MTDCLNHSGNSFHFPHNLFPIQNCTEHTVITPSVIVMQLLQQITCYAWLSETGDVLMCASYNSKFVFIYRVR